MSDSISFDLKRPYNNNEPHDVCVVLNPECEAFLRTNRPGHNAITHIVAEYEVGLHNPVEICFGPWQFDSEKNGQVNLPNGVIVDSYCLWSKLFI